MRRRLVKQELGEDGRQGTPGDLHAHNRDTYCLTHLDDGTTQMDNNLASQEGIEPSTCRLRARNLPCSAVLDIALSWSLQQSTDEAECRDYPVLPAFFKHVPYKSPYSVFWAFFRQRDHALESSKQASLPLPAFALSVAYLPFPAVSRGDSARRWAVLRCSSANGAGRRSATASRCSPGRFGP
jgi:hypothetical protein